MDIMTNRLSLQNELECILKSEEVYFQPPANICMSYPAIVYRRSVNRTTWGDNRIYRNGNHYLLTVIDTNPDSDIFERVLTHFEYIRPERTYIADGLYHHVLDLYY